MSTPVIYILILFLGVHLTPVKVAEYDSLKSCNTASELFNGQGQCVPIYTNGKIDKHVK